MAFRYTPEQIRRLEAMGAFDPGISLLTITGKGRTRIKHAWGSDDDE